MRDLIRQFQPRSELRESRNEIVVGEVIRAMARLGYPSVMFRIHDDRQQLRFRAVGRTDLSTVTVTVERPAGSGALTEAMFGNQLRLDVVAELRQRTTDPASLLAAATRRPGPPPAGADVRVERELSSLLAHTTRTVDVDAMVGTGPRPDAPLTDLMRETIDTLAHALAAST